MPYHCVFNEDHRGIFVSFNFRRGPYQDKGSPCFQYLGWPAAHGIPLIPVGMLI